jgi:hypothetical protein
MEPQGPIAVPQQVFRPNADYLSAAKLIVVTTVKGGEFGTAGVNSEKISDLATLRWIQQKFGPFSWRRYVGFAVRLPDGFMLPTHQPKVADLLIQVETLLQRQSGTREYPFGAGGIRGVFYDQAGSLTVNLFPR